MSLMSLCAGAEEIYMSIFENGNAALLYGPCLLVSTFKIPII